MPLPTRHAHLAVSSVVTTFETTGTPPPEPVRQAHDRYTTTRQAFADRPRPGLDDLTNAVLAAIEDGRDPAADPDIQRITTALDLASRGALTDNIDGLLITGLRAACTDHADAIIETWRGPFATAAEAITTAHAKLGPIALTDSDRVVRAGPAATTAWHTAVTAVRTLETIDRGWTALHSFTRGGPPPKPFALLRVAHVDPDVWLDSGYGGRKADPWAATLDGLTLALPTIDEHRAQVDAIKQTAEHRPALAEQAQRARRPSLAPRGTHPAPAA